MFSYLRLKIPQTPLLCQQSLWLWAKLCSQRQPWHCLPLTCSSARLPCSSSTRGKAWFPIPRSSGLGDLVLRTECGVSDIQGEGTRTTSCSLSVCCLESLLLRAQAIWRVCMWVLGPQAQLSPAFRSSSPQPFRLSTWGPGIMEWGQAIPLFLSQSLDPQSLWAQ